MGLVTVRLAESGIAEQQCVCRPAVSGAETRDAACTVALPEASITQSPNARLDF